MTDLSTELKSLNNELPKPIAFSCWKHHLGYVKNVLETGGQHSKTDSFIREVVQYLGDSNIDYYIGDFNALEISNEILKKIESESALEINSYKRWLGSDGADFRCVQLPDGSSWTLRFGLNDKRFIHIHPSRHSKKTVRIKSSTLKTVYAFLFYYGLSDDEVSIEKVNFVRNRLAKLPVFKPTSALSAFRRAMKLFQS